MILARALAWFKPRHLEPARTDEPQISVSEHEWYSGPNTADVVSWGTTWHKSGFPESAKLDLYSEMDTI